MPEGKTTKIIISSADGFAKRVPIGVNGQVTHLPIGEEVEVGEHILSVLSGDTRYKFTEVQAAAGTDGAESGVGSAPSTTEHTALQQEPVNEPIYTNGVEADPTAAPPALGEGAKGSATGEQGDGTGFRDDAANEVDPAPGEGGTTGGQDGETGSRTQVEGGQKSVPSSDQEGGEPNKDEGGEQQPKAETVAALTERASKVEDPAQLDAM
ncbi:MAG TPA: hypothetical protein VD768_06215, partial [Sphingomicrobium sp.]|nr:hypothetical protein [Sphingomicrobium sp.]